MKNNCTNRIITVVAIIMAIFNTAPAIAWTGDINVNPDPGKVYTMARVSVSYDNIIYVGRVYANMGESFQHWEVLKSVDNGITFSLFKLGYTSDDEKITAFDIIAAGKEGHSRIFVAYGILDTVNADAKLYMTEYMPSGTINLSGINLNTNYSGTTRGYSCISLASDWKDANTSATHFSLSMVAAKASSFDSVIVWSDNEAGATLNRKGIYGTPGFIRNVSCAIGSASTSGYGRLGISWDEFNSSSDEWGTLHVKYVYPDNAGNVNNGGPYEVVPFNNSRAPRIALSQNNALPDIYTYIVYESEGGTNETNVNIETDNNILSGPAVFNIGGALGGNVLGKQVNPDIVYCAATDSFYATYFDEPSSHLVVAAKKDVESLSLLTEMVDDYRDIFGVVESPMPRLDVLHSGRMYFTWNEDNKTWFDGQSVWPASVQNVSSNLQEIKLYPNPATDNITLSFMAEEKDNATLFITDISGKTVQSTQTAINSGNNQIPVALYNLPAGNYILRIAGSHTNTSMMFTVQQ